MVVKNKLSKKALLLTVLAISFAWQTPHIMGAAGGMFLDDPSVHRNQDEYLLFEFTCQNDGANICDLLEELDDDYKPVVSVNAVHPIHKITPLFWAVGGRNKNSLKALLSDPAIKVNFKIKETGDTVLHVFFHPDHGLANSTESRAYETLEMLLQDPRISLSMKNKAKNTALHEAVRNRAPVCFIELLLEYAKSARRILAINNRDNENPVGLNQRLLGQLDPQANAELHAYHGTVRDLFLRYLG